MKITIVTPGGVDRSGTHRVIPALLWFIERLIRSGDDVHVFALRQERARAQWNLLGASVHNVGGAVPLARAAGLLSELRKEHRRGPFDVIHALWAVPQGAWSAIAGKMLGVPVLLHLPGGDIVDLPEINYGGRSTVGGRIALRLAVAGAARVIVPSDDMVRQARRIRIQAQRVPLGVALDHWPVRPPRRRADGAPACLLHVGSLSPVKDQDMLLVAMRYLREKGIAFFLNIVGEDTLHGATARHAHEFGLSDCVRFHGFLPQPELKEIVQASDLLIVSSRHEAGPIVALEAAALGIPSVGTRVGLLSDWAPDAARVVDVGDGHALGVLIADVLANEELRLALAREAQRRAIAENADVTAPRIRNIYFEMIEARTRSGSHAKRSAAVH